MLSTCYRVGVVLRPNKTRLLKFIHSRLVSLVLKDMPSIGKRISCRHIAILLQTVLRSPSLPKSLLPSLFQNKKACRSEMTAVSHDSLLLLSYQFCQCTAIKDVLLLTAVHEHLIIQIQALPISFKFLLAVSFNLFEPEKNRSETK